MASVNAKFAAHVTSLAFSLQLSKPQIIRLVEIATRPNLGGNLFRILGAYDNSVAAGRALEEKGLVYAKDPSLPGLYTMTEAGELVFQLLQMAGLVEKIEQKVNAA